MTSTFDADAGVVAVSGLTKRFGAVTAVDDLSFTVTPGRVTGFLGPNGAGKSTTMKMLTGYIAPSEGTARISGFDMSTHRLEGSKRLGYLPENGPLYPDMTPFSSLEFFAEARGMRKGYKKERIEAVVERCDLKTVLHKPINKLSKGYKQRVGMAQALLHEPDVLILDEPTGGLDPNQIREVRNTIRRLGESKTILLSTHILQEVQAMASRVIMINEGRLVYDGEATNFDPAGIGLDERFGELSIGRTS